MLLRYSVRRVVLLSVHWQEGAVGQNSAEVTKFVYADIVLISISVHEILSLSFH